MTKSRSKNKLGLIWPNQILGDSFLTGYKIQEGKRLLTHNIIIFVIQDQNIFQNLTPLSRYSQFVTWILIFLFWNSQTIFGFFFDMLSNISLDKLYLPLPFPSFNLFFKVSLLARSIYIYFKSLLTLITFLFWP